MKKKIATKWVAALRSGKYRQTTHNLHDANGFCCLGVLCHILKDDLNTKWKKPDWKDYVYDDATTAYSYCTTKSSGKSWENEDEILPNQVVKFVSMKSNMGKLPEQFGPNASLVEMNDDGRNFKEIAKIIEENWKDL